MINHKIAYLEEYKTLALICGVKRFGAVSYGIDEIYIDTSQSQSKAGYNRALNFANYLAEQKKII